MNLTASDHQKIAALQQIARMVSQMQIVSGNTAVQQNVVNNLLPLVEMYTSDPTFQELASLLRRMRVDTSPHLRAEITGVVNSMLMDVQAALPERKNAQGETVIWDPMRGNITSPRFEKGERDTILSPYDDWRGSRKYPFGKAFPDAWSLNDYTQTLSDYKGYIACGAVAVIAILVVKKFLSK